MCSEAKRQIVALEQEIRQLAELRGRQIDSVQQVGVGRASLLTPAEIAVQ
jgi:hypothetical protein